MITASHNPPSDNAIKMFWSSGGQLKPPHDEGVIERVYQADAIPCVPFSEALAAGNVQFCQAEMDPAYQAAVLQAGFAGPRDLKILYSPLHGVGLTSVLPVLQQDGFHQVEVFAPHAEPSGDFPNVPGNIANPENPAVFDALIAHAGQVGAGVALATDPDADRLGVAAPLTAAADSPWQTLSGNQIGVLLAEYVLRHRQQAGTLSPEHYVIKTIVTTNMLARQAAAYGIRCLGDVLTGFKWIGGLIEDEGPNMFVFGFEEAHGYLAGTHCRDKDGAVAALLMAQLAAECHAQGRTLHEVLQSLYDKYGHYREKQISLTLPGSQGMAEMQQMMQRLRTSPPRTLAGRNVQQVRDYAARTDGPQSDVLIFETDQPDFYAAIRPSGTEPKLKFYLFGRDVPAEQLDALYNDLLK
jgi:phosphoglucomutase/phosphomannomutase